VIECILKNAGKWQQSVERYPGSAEHKRMASKLRTLLVGLVCLGAVLAVYVVYDRFNETGPIDVSPPREFTESIVDSNSGIGTIGNVGINKLVNAEYITYDRKTKKPERVFGFRRLLDAQGDQWDLDQPYIVVFWPGFECRVSADTGRMQVEDGLGGPAPRSGDLSGNVVVHIVPTRAGETGESFVYLDDVHFVSERSQLTTAGPVEFVSENVRMLGRGLDLVYDSQLDRLDYLRVIDLKWLRTKSASAGLLAGNETKSNETKSDGPSPGHDGTRPQSEPATAVSTDNGQEPKAAPIPAEETAPQRPPQPYRCTFSKNVVIDGPNELVAADEQVSIVDIIWADGTDKTTNNSSTDSLDEGTTEEATTKGVPEVAAGPGKTDANMAKPAAASGDDRQDGPPAASGGDGHDRPPVPTDGEFDTVMTCERGMLVTPMDSNLSAEDFDDPLRERPGTRDEILMARDDANERTTLNAKWIDYSAATAEMVVGGPLELIFYPNDVLVPGSNETAPGTVPATVTATKEARFLPDSNQAVFTGDCVCTMLRQDANGSKAYKLRSQRLVVDLLGDQQGPAAPGSDIEHLTASGGTVRLTSTKTVQDKMLSAVELECRQFDFDGIEQMFQATGPGVIEIDNSNVPEPNAEPNSTSEGRFSFRKRSWAMVEDFDTLKFFTSSNLLIADGLSQQVRIGYVPVIEDDQYGSPVKASAGHAEAVLYETPNGQYELSTFNATGGVTYEDEDKQFEGDELSHDADKSLVTVAGDCRFNGVPVDGIEWDLLTDRIKFQVTGLGTLQPPEPSD
jgi:hypothetical protein